MKSPRGVLQESSRRCADTRKRGKYDQNKESSRSAEKSPRDAAQILGSGESATKIKSPRGALKRYSEARKVPLK